MEIFDLKPWHFDFRTALFVLLFIPVITYLIKILAKNLKDWSGYALDGVLYGIGRTLKHTLAASLTLKKYCNLILKGSYRHLHVPSRSEIALDIDQVYVPLILEQQGNKQATYTHTNLLSAGNRIRVVGDPGSGKSSLIKKLLRDACHAAIKKPSKSLLPIFFELKNIDIAPEVPTNKLGEWFYNKLNGLVSNHAVYKMEDCFENYARTTGVLVLLDGLDEISSTQYLKAREAILGLSEKLNQLSDANSIVLTTRTQFHSQIKDEYREQFPYVMFLKPFSPSDVYEFLTRWPFTKEREQGISRIFNELADKPTLREMCTNPLILSMYVADYQTDGSGIPPETRTEFYSKITEELLVKRRLRQTKTTIARTKLKEQRERILGRLSYEHLLDPNQPANSLKWSSALKTVSLILGCNEVEAELIFRELAKDTGLITEEREGESLRFIHLTFCEFLAASEAIQEQTDGWSQLINTHKQFQQEQKPHLQSRLVEVIPFACGLLQRSYRPKALNDVAEIDNGRILARSFLETKSYEHASWPVFVKNEYARLLRIPEDHWDAEWLRSLHLFNVVVKDSEQCAIHAPVAQTSVDLDEFYKHLVSKQQQSLATLFSMYATQDAAAALRLAEICHLDLADKFPDIIISNCDQTPFFAVVRQRALQDNNRVGLWSSVLSESALRSRAVATWMNDTVPVSEWQCFADEVPKKRRWFRTGLCNKTFLTQSITIALGPRGIANNDTFIMLKLLKQVPPPGGGKFLGFGGYYLASAFLVYSFFTLDIINHNFIFGLLPQLACITVSYYWSLRYLSFKQMFKQTLFGNDDTFVKRPFIVRLKYPRIPISLIGKKLRNLQELITRQRKSGFSNGSILQLEPQRLEPARHVGTG